MSHITLSQLTTVLQRIVSWAGQRFAAKNTVSGKLEYADMPVVVLASMGSALDGTNNPLLATNAVYFSPAGNGVEARIMRKNAQNPDSKISDPDSGVIYCNATTNLLYRWKSSNSTMVPVGGVQSTGVANIVVCASQTDYNNISPKDSNTLYLIKE